MVHNEAVNTRVHSNEASMLVKDISLPGTYLAGLEMEWGPQFAQILDGDSETYAATLNGGVALDHFYMPSPTYGALIGGPASRARVSLITSKQGGGETLSEGIVELSNRENDITSQIHITSADVALEAGLSQTHANGRPGKYQPTDENGLPEALPLDQEITNLLLDELLFQNGVVQNDSDTILDKLRALVGRSAKHQSTQRALYEWEAGHDTLISTRVQRTIRVVGVVALSELELDMRTKQQLSHGGGELLSHFALVCGGITAAPHVRLNVGIRNTSFRALPLEERRAIFEGIEHNLGTKPGVQRMLGKTAQLLGNPQLDDPQVVVRPHDDPRFQTDPLD